MTYLDSQSRFVRPCSLVLAIATGTVSCALLAGCGEEPRIVSYTVPKQPPDQQPKVKDDAPRSPHGPGFAQSGFGRPQLPPGASGGVSSRKSPNLQYDVPTGWEQDAGNQFSLAAFRIGDGERTAKVTVSAIGGSIEANINRWRGQVGLPSLSMEEIRKEGETIPIGDSEGLFVELFGPEQDGKQPAILGAVVQAAGRQWFFKFTGDGELAQQETERFRQFMKSVRFDGSEESGDGE